jgi:hypothetical protein
MDLKEIVERYKKTAGGFGKSVALSALGISRAETEKAFDMLDEDYHISRFIHFANASAAAGATSGSYSINGFPQTHVSIDSSIQEIL